MSPDEIRRGFPQLGTLDDLAQFLSLNPNHIRLLLVELPALYQSFEIKKRSGGTRPISAPKPQLYLVQSRLKHVFDALYSPAPSVHGFVANRSIVSNAEPHVRARNVLNIDLEEFFPSIHAGRISGLLQTSVYGASAEVAAILAALCCKDGVLPIGAPTSPVLSNMVSFHLDKDLLNVARKFNCYYTRYADDITLSNRRWDFPKSLASRNYRGAVELGSDLTQVIEQNGFRPNLGKTRLQRKSEKQVVTGIVVNKRTNVDRRYIRRIRAMLHSWETGGLEAAEARFNEQFGGSTWNDLPPRFKDSLGGMVSFVEMVKGADDPVASRLRYRYEELKDGRVPLPQVPQRGKLPQGEPLKILHLSDLHLSDSRIVDAEPLLDELRGFLRQQPQPDLILVTGDIGQAGVSSDYRHATTFFGKLLNDLGVEKSQIYFVPGNHDVDRTQITFASESLHDRLRETDSQTKLDADLERAFGATNDRELLLGKFCDYMSFARTFTGDPDRSELTWSQAIDHHGAKVVIAGVNTALLSYNDEDKHRLVIGKFNARRATEHTGDLQISIFHHPLEELSNGDPNSASIIKAWSDIMLRGHTHERSVGRILKNGDEYHEIAVGSTHQGTTYANGAAIHEVDLNGNRLRSQSIDWNVPSQSWRLGADEGWIEFRTRDNPRLGP